MKKRKKHKKAIMKAITWRIVSSSALFIIMLATGMNIKSAGAFTVVDAVVKLVLYYLHELFWQGRGKSKRK